MRSVSVKSYTDYVDCPGVPLINFKDGYDSIIKYFVSQLPPNSIELNKPVNRVQYDLSGTRVSLELAGEHDLREFNHVIITSSAGFLKERVKDFFSPRLPPRKELAIANLGFGTINKIYLQFEEPFWERDELGFQLLWTEEEEVEKEDEDEDEDEKKKTHAARDKFPPWVFSISGFDIVRNQASVLVAWIGGKGAELVEKCESDKLIGDICAQVLRRFLPRRNVQNPVKVVSSKWRSNEYVRGAYSNRSIEYETLGLDLNDFIEPIFSTVKSYREEDDEEEQKEKEDAEAEDAEKDDVKCVTEWPLILFAGESTEPSYFSTTHGAMSSGIREAQRLLEMC